MEIMGPWGNALMERMIKGLFFFFSLSWYAAFLIDVINPKNPIEN